MVSRINQYLDDDAFRNIALGQNYFELQSIYHKALKLILSRFESIK